MEELAPNPSRPDAGDAAGVRLTAYVWPVVSLAYSVFEVCRPHSKWMLSMWWASVLSSVAWVALVPYLERLKRSLVPVAVPVEAATSTPAEGLDAR